MRRYGSSVRLAGAIGLTLALASIAAAPAPFAEFQVNSFSDAVDIAPGNGICNASPDAFPPVCTLRAAVQEVNALGGGAPHVIRLEAGTYLLSRTDVSQRVEDRLEEDRLLTSVEAAAHNDLDIDVGLRLIGAGQDSTFIDGGREVRVLEVGGTADVSIEDLTVQHGIAVSPQRGGGGIRVDGAAIASLLRVTVQENETTFNGIIEPGAPPASGGFGGGIEARGDTTIRESIVRENSAYKLGGGISARSLLVVVDSIVTGNVATGNSSFPVPRGPRTGSGGGIGGRGDELTCADVRLMGSTVSGNSSRAQGGGVAVAGDLFLTNSTVSGNTSASDGGGIYYKHTNCREVGGARTTTFRGSFSTIALNRAVGAAATAGLHVDGNVDARVQGVLLARNRGARNALLNCGGVVRRLVSDGHNADDGFSCRFRRPADSIGVYIDFGPLGDNGGPTPTHALAPSPIFRNPAIDGGGDSGPGTDQRGIVRPQGAAWDIGAFEFEGVFPDRTTRIPLEVPGNITFLDGFVIPIRLGGPGVGDAEINDVVQGNVGGNFEVEIAQDGRSAIVRGDQIGLDLSKPSDNPNGERPLLFTVSVTRAMQGDVELRVIGGEIDGKVRYDGTSLWIIKPLK